MKLTLEKDLYVEAKMKGLSFTEFVDRQLRELGDPDFEVNLSDDNPLDGFEFLLAQHGIKVTGAEVSLVDDFYKTTQSAVLFPEFINRNIRIGMELGRNACKTEDLIATTVTIDSGEYRAGYAELDSENAGAFRVSESSEFPKTKMTLSEKALALSKYGHSVEMSYEVRRRQKIDQLAIHLQLIGRRLRNKLVEWALDVLVNGDGNSNPAPVFSATGLNYNNLVDFDAEFDDFEPTVWVGDKATITGLLKLTEFKDPLAGFNYQATGNLISPLGVTLKRNDSVAASTLIGVDKNFALEMIEEAGGDLQETEKLITRQTDVAVFSQSATFAKIYTGACRVWDYS